MGGAKLLKWRLAAEGAKLLKSGAALIGPPGAIAENSARRAPVIYQDTKSKPPRKPPFCARAGGP